MAELPVTYPELVAQCTREYEEAAKLGGPNAVEACTRLAWVQVHSSHKPDIAAGQRLAEALLHGENPSKRDLSYIVAVAQYRTRSYLEARRILSELVAEEPAFRQAQSLLEAAEAQIVKDGLVGVGAGVAVLGVVAAIVAAAVRKR